MTDPNATKPVLLSRTVLFGIVALVASIAQMLGAPAELTSAAFQREAVEVMLQIAAAVGALGAIIFRIRARTRLR